MHALGRGFAYGGDGWEVMLSGRSWLSFRFGFFSLSLLAVLLQVRQVGGTPVRNVVPSSSEASLQRTNNSSLPREANPP